jgi:hypothetical protein
MPRRKLFILLAAVIFIGCDIAILTWYFTRKPEYKEPPLSFDGPSENLRHTVIVPTLDTPIPEGKNAIWCASFQLAWNKLKSDVTKGPVQLQGAEEIAKRLNDANVTEADLPEGSWYAAAGLVKDGIEKSIQREMQRRFPRRPAPDFGEHPDRVAVAYSYLESEVRFAKLFEVLDEPLMFTDASGREAKLAGFGILEKTVREHRDRDLQAQVRVLAVKSPAEFAVQLLGEPTATELILVMLPARNTLATLLVDADAVLKVGQRLAVHNTLAVPILNSWIVHRYKELESRPILNESLPDSFLAVAYQMIRFKLDRSGVELKSEAVIESDKKADGGDPVQLHFNRPFLILLKKRGAAQPFFAMWVDNAELLRKWGD